MKISAVEIFSEDLAQALTCDLMWDDVRRSSLDLAPGIDLSILFSESIQTGEKFDSALCLLDDGSDYRRASRIWKIAS